MSFLVLSLPRSRSYWISRYLSYPPYTCGHDIILGCNSLKELIRKFTTLTGSVELSVGLAWKPFMNLFPEVRIVTVRRDLDEVSNSLRNIGVYIPTEELEMRDKALINCGRHPNVMTVDYRDLENPECCEWLFEYCLGQKWDEKWYAEFAKSNLQLNINQRMTLVRQRFPIIQKILLEAATIDSSLQEYYVS